MTRAVRLADYPRLASLADPATRQALADGDLLLVRRRGLIAQKGRGRWSHAAMLALWDDTPMMLEVREWVGGRAVTLASQVRRRPGRIDHFRLRGGGIRAPFSRRGAVAAMRRFCGSPYGWWAVARAAVVHTLFLGALLPPDLDDADALSGPPYCSHAVAHAWRTGGLVDPVPQLADRFTEPSDLARSWLFRYHQTLTP